MVRRLKIHCAILATLLVLPTFATPIEDQLVTRTYKLDLAKIKDLPAPTPATNASPSDLLRALFSNEGITFPTNLIPPIASSNKIEKAFYLNERTGELHLRATRRDIPKFEKYLARLAQRPDPPDVEIETILVEIPLPDPPATTRILTLEPRSIFTNLASLNGFTNVAVITAKARETTLKSLQPFDGFTFTEPPTVRMMRGQRIRIPLDGSAPYPYVPAAPVITAPSFGGGALIIRSESDVR